MAKAEKQNKQPPDFFLLVTFFLLGCFSVPACCLAAGRGGWKGPSVRPLLIMWPLICLDSVTSRRWRERKARRDPSQSHQREKNRAQFYCSGCDAQCEHETGIQRTFVRLAGSKCDPSALFTRLPRTSAVKSALATAWGKHLCEALREFFLPLCRTLKSFITHIIT